MTQDPYLPPAARVDDPRYAPGVRWGRVLGFALCVQAAMIAATYAIAEVEFRVITDLGDGYLAYADAFRALRIVVVESVRLAGFVLFLRPTRVARVPQAAILWMALLLLDTVVTAIVFQAFSNAWQPVSLARSLFAPALAVAALAFIERQRRQR